MDALTAIPLTSACSVTLHRTLRIPDDGEDYPLPPSLGTMPVYRADDGAYVVPMRRAEALWMSFDTVWSRPHALKVGIGGVDALSGETFVPDRLSADPQDYVVLPDQPWLDGVNAGDGVVRQFVAVPLGEGLTVEAQLTGAEREGGLTLSAFAARHRRIADEDRLWGVQAAACSCEAMGLGAGGRMRQEIYADDYGLNSWEPEPAATVRVELVDALAFETLTGIPVPGETTDARTYTAHGLPWFDLLQPTGADIRAAARLAGIRSVADLEGREEAPLPIPEAQVVRLLRLRTLAAECAR